MRAPGSVSVSLSPPSGLRSPTGTSSDQRHRRLAAVLLAGGAAGLAAGVAAQPYLAIGAGVTQYHSDVISEIASAYRATPGRTVSGRITDSRDAGFSLAGGWQLHPNVAVEVGYYDLGRPEAGYSISEVLYNAKLSYKLSGFGASVVGRWPIAGGFSVHGRLGVMAARNEYHEDGTAVLTFQGGTRVDFRHTTRTTSPMYGLGVGYAFTRNLEVRGEWTRFDRVGKSWAFEDDHNGRFDVDLFSASLVYRF